MDQLTGVPDVTAYPGLGKMVMLCSCMLLGLFHGYSSSCFTLGSRDETLLRALEMTTCTIVKIWDKKWGLETVGSGCEVFFFCFCFSLLNYVVFALGIRIYHRTKLIHSLLQGSIQETRQVTFHLNLLTVGLGLNLCVCGVVVSGSTSLFVLYLCSFFYTWTSVNLVQVVQHCLSCYC